MTEEILHFVNSRVSTQTPSEIYQNLQTSELACVEHVVQHQIYYQWKQANKKYRRRHDDQLLSAKQLLEELGESYLNKQFLQANIRTLGIYVRASIKALSETTKEVAIDATIGTNNASMDLYAVFAELGETGVPLAYLFIEKNN